MMKIISIAGLPLRISLLIALCVCVVIAQTHRPVAKGNADYAALAKVPRNATSRRNPFEGDPDAIAAGAKLFERHCAECHGADAGGGRKAPSLLVDEVQGAMPGAIFWIVSNGVVRRGMPVWSKLPEPQRWQIVSYVKSLKATEKVMP